LDNPIKLVELKEFNEGLDLCAEKQRIARSQKFHELDLDHYLNEEGVIIVLKDDWERWING